MHPEQRRARGQAPRSHGAGRKCRVWGGAACAQGAGERRRHTLFIFSPVPRGPHGPYDDPWSPGGLLCALRANLHMEGKGQPASACQRHGPGSAGARGHPCPTPHAPRPCRRRQPAARGLARVIKCRVRGRHFQCSESSDLAPHRNLAALGTETLPPLPVPLGRGAASRHQVYGKPWSRQSHFLTQ